MAEVPRFQYGWMPTRLPQLLAHPQGSVTDNQLSVFSVSSESHVPWIQTIADLATSGWCQVAILIISFLWTLYSIRASKPIKVAPHHAKASQISVGFELCSQITRACALAFIIIAAVRGDTQQWYNVALVTVAFALGLTRLASGLRWRHIALHQTNFLLGASLLLLAAAEVMPSMEMHSAYRPGDMVIGALVSLAAANLVAIITPREWAPSPAIFEMLDAPEKLIPAPEETCSWWNLYLTFEWLTPLVWKGCRRPVDVDDLPPLPWYDEPLYLLSKINEARARSSNTLWTVLRFVRVELALMSFFAGASFAVELVAPFAMYQLLAYLSNPDKAALSPVIWLILLFLGPMTKTVFFQQYIFTSTRLIVRVKAAMTQELYHRAMSSMELEGDVLNDAKGQEAAANKTTHAGQLQNLMSGDIDAIWQARDIVMMGVGAPIGVILSFIGLYAILDWPALIGSALMVIAIPVPTYIAQLMGKSQRQVKATQDARISLISEYLGSIRAIKYFAWEDAMAKIIDNARDAEQKVLWKIAVLYTLLGEAVEFMPMVSLVVMFTLYTSVLKEPLTAQVAFTVLSLVSTMRNNIGMFGYFSKSATNAWISFDRLNRYFTNTTPLITYPEGPLRIESATFKRNKKADFVLKDISIDFVEGGLNTIFGASGSGKTTLLLSILGETIKESGSVTRPDDVAFSSQTAWLQSTSIKDNILFSSPLEEARYKRVIEACCLPLDLSELPDGDETEVGENGTALSGGQKARVALARALYSKAPLLLLDDIFSALDSKTTASVWEQCFCSDLLKGRTVVLVTQVKWIAEQADLHVVLENGIITSQEQHIGVVRKPVEVAKDAIEGDGPEAKAVTNGNGTNGVNGAGEAAKPSDASKPKKDDISKEMEATGATGRMSFFQYMTYFGGPAYPILTLLATVVGTASLLATTLWVSVWVDAVDRGSAVDVGYYLGIYTAIATGNLIVDGLVFLIYANGGWQAAKRLHAEFVRSVMNVSLSWFKDTPTGRIVNRFSRDMASLDNQLNRMLQGTIQLAVELVFRLGAVTAIMPVFIFPGLISCVVGLVAGEMYTRTAVVVKRLVSSAQSPVFSQFNDDMAGIQIIRARKGVAQSFGNLLADRLRPFNRANETNFNLNRWVGLRIDFVTALVMACAGAIAISKVGLIPAGLVGFSLTNASGLSSTILYLVRIANELEVELQSFHRVREYASLEPEEKTEDAAVVVQTPPQQQQPQPPQEVPASWPATGAIEFRNVTIRYDPDGPDILKDISLKFAAGERVAVVGRTGSGKSTLVLSLLRFTHVVTGQILYDGVDITHVPRRRLRRSLTIIPQEAVLFNGTVGTNLDPAGDAPPGVVEGALASCAGIASFKFRDRDGDHPTAPGTDGKDDGEEEQVIGATTPPTEQTPLLSGLSTPAAEAISSSAAGLSPSTTVDARGENFSHGQRQVLSLCRALVRKSKLMLLDEATASMDYETDHGIQAVLRREIFGGGGPSDGGRTLVTIAHRLRTIADYDKVVVMGGGRVLEMGSPKELFGAKGTFYDMVQHSGEVKELQGVFGDSE